MKQLTYQRNTGPPNARVAASFNPRTSRPACLRRANSTATKASGRLLSESQANALDSVDMSSALTLENIRNSLIRQEDTILFNLIERAQFARNSPVYQTSSIAVPEGADGSGSSLLEYMLKETEKLHAKVRRYTSPDEHAFYPEALPPMILPPLAYPEVLAPYAKEININNRIMSMYLNDVLPVITTPGDDNNYGSAACLDLLCLQALSKRIHYGKFVAEAKFRAAPEQYSALIRARDAEGIMALLTDRKVELQVVDRVRLKAVTYGQDVRGPTAVTTQGPPHYKVQPDMVAELYDTLVMPMTKDVQVEYLLRRLEQ